MNALRGNPIRPGPLWTGAALAAATAGELRQGFDAQGISIDTRTLRPGQMFVALVGENGDGHAHVAQALARGAAGAMVHDLAGLDESAPLLAVGDTLQGLRDLAAAGRTRFAGRLAAVTGSVGKTTTKEMLRAILAEAGDPAGRTHAAEASHNNQWGLPLTLARLPPDDAYCVAEIGMNHAGEIAPLARLARPHVAIITNVEAAHIGYLGSLEAIADEKASLLTGLEPTDLEPGGIAILPADSPLLPRLLAAAGDARIVTFGAKSGTFRLLEVAADATGSDVTLDADGTLIRFRLPAPGRHMALDSVGAIAAAAALGVPPAAAAEALAGFAAIGGRGMQRRILGGRAVLLDESYNASPVAVRAALDILKLIPSERRVAVLGDMRELGAHAPAAHAGLARAVACAADVVYACGPEMAHLFAAIPESLRGRHMPDAASLGPVVAEAVRPGDAVLVKGSLGSRMKLVVEALEHAGERS